AGVYDPFSGANVSEQAAVHAEVGSCEVGVAPLIARDKLDSAVIQNFHHADEPCVSASALRAVSASVCPYVIAVAIAAYASAARKWASALCVECDCEITASASAVEFQTVKTFTARKRYPASGFHRAVPEVA